jgi:hypothetical protein
VISVASSVLWRFAWDGIYFNIKDEFLPYVGKIPRYNNRVAQHSNFALGHDSGLRILALGVSVGRGKGIPNNVVDDGCTLTKIIYKKGKYQVLVY